MAQSFVLVLKTLIYSIRTLFIIEMRIFDLNPFYVSVLISSVIRQKGKSRNIPYPMIRTCAYQGVRNFHFSENLTCFVFLKHLFWDSPFCLITDDLLQCLSVFCSKCTANQMTSFYMKCNFGPDWGITEASLFQFLSLLIPNLVFTRLSIRRIKTWQRIEASVLTHFMLYCPSRDIFPNFFLKIVHHNDN